MHLKWRSHSFRLPVLTKQVALSLLKMVNAKFTVQDHTVPFLVLYLVSTASTVSILQLSKVLNPRNTTPTLRVVRSPSTSFTTVWGTSISRHCERWSMKVPSKVSNWILHQHPHFANLACEERPIAKLFQSLVRQRTQNMEIKSLPIFGDQPKSNLLEVTPSHRCLRIYTPTSPVLLS